MDTEWKANAINLTHKTLYKTKELELPFQKADNFHFLLSINELTKLYEESQPDTKTNEESKKIIYEMNQKNLQMKYAQSFLTSYTEESKKKKENPKSVFKLTMDDFKSNNVLSTIFTQVKSLKI
jgi:hypothetical protein